MFDGVQLFNTIIYKFCLIGTGLLRALPTSMNTQALGGGGKNFFFRFGNLHVVRGVRGYAPPRKFFKTVQFSAF